MQTPAPLLAEAGFNLRRLHIFCHPAARYGSGLLSGVLLAACFRRFDLHQLVWIAPLPLLLAAIHERRLKQAYFVGALCGAVFLAISVYWFDFVLENYGHLPRPTALAVMMLFLVLQSSYWGVFALVIAWMARRSCTYALLLAPFLWVTMELAETYGYFGGFPWNLLGYAVQPDGLRQLAAVIGVYGLSFIALSTSILVAGAVLAKPEFRRRSSLVVLLWAAMLVGYNRWFQPPAPQPGRDLAILVQPDIPLDQASDPWDPRQNPANLRRLVDLTLKTLRGSPPGAKPPLLIWSENPAPFYYGRDPVFRGVMQELARQAHAYFVFGTVNFTGGSSPGPLNSADVLDPAGNLILQYDKIHLVPFGEYVPPWLDHWVGKITSEAGNFVPGSNYAPATTGSGKIGLSICYEEIFPRLVRRVTPSGPSVMVNISDDGWYGDSSARYQSLEMSRIRAIENHRYLLRSTNDGMTAVIDPYGRVLQKLPPRTPAATAVHFDYESAETPYHALGDVFAALCLAVSGVGIALRVRMSGGRKESR